MRTSLPCSLANAARVLRLMIHDCYRRSRRHREIHGHVPPEEVLHIGQFGGILAPIGAFFASCHPQHFAPIIQHRANRILSQRSLLACLHNLPFRPLDNSHPQLHPLRRRNLLHLHLRVHIPRRRLPARCRVCTRIQ